MLRYADFTYESEKYSSMTEELKDLQRSENFIDWMYELSGRKGSRLVPSKEELIGGYCEDLAVYLHFKYAADLFCTDDASIHDGHYFVKHEGKYYDAMNPEGVIKPSEFEWSKRLMQRRSDVTAEMIDGVLKPLGIEWSGYANSKHVVKPVNESKNFSEQKIIDALHFVKMSRTARFDPEFGAETWSYDKKGKPNSFVEHDKVGKYKALGSKGPYEEIKSKVIVAYDQQGDIVGALNICMSDPVGAFKIVVREDAQRQGWGGKLLSEAERLGYDMVSYMRQNTFSYAGRYMATKWLEAKLKNVKENFEPRRVSEREDDDNEIAKNNKLRTIFRKHLTMFHNGYINLEQLQQKLLADNPNPNGDMTHQFYIDWINDNIDAYKNGEHYLLSMTSSGGMLASLQE